VHGVLHLSGLFFSGACSTSAPCINRKKEKEAVLATKISERGIEPALLATERTSVTSQTQRVIHQMDAQQAI